MPSAPLILLLALSGTVPAAEPAPALKHRFYIAPDEIRALDSRTLAKLLVERIHRECDLADAPPAGEKVLGDDTEMIMMVPSGLFDAIERKGFLNQHQTRTTGGQHRETDRFEAEQELAMLRLPFGALELLPKYAVLDVQKSGLGTYPLPTQYGGVAVVFKAGVSERATWTYADSLDYSQKSGRFDTGGANNPVLARTFLYERKKEDRNRCGNYCEAQIWGKLSLDDVAYAMVRDSEPVPDALARAGIPVYDYSVPDSTSAVVDANRTAQYIRGALRHIKPSRILPAPAEPSNSSSGAIERTLLAVEGEFTVGQMLLGLYVIGQSSPTKADGLEKKFASGDARTREFVLYGLSELPWAEFKPRLLESLDVAPGPLLISAVAVAADHQDDADVSARLERLRRAPASPASEWVERLTKTSLCSPR
jgi:hypothetical protein